MEQELMRIGISLPENLLEKFDEIMKKRGYSSRSEGIRDAIRTYILNYEWMNETKGDKFGVIQIVYNYTQKSLVDSIETIQHEYRDIVESTYRVPISSTNLLEIIFARGEGSRVKNMAESIMALKSLYYAKWLTIPLKME
ncbi:MAG: nickel-responsive transcriptional regulator NikR [Methanosarcinales archaeon]